MADHFNTLDTGPQPLDLDLTAIAALTTTPYGRALLALADQAALTAAIAAATTSLPGISELATSAETITGTDTTRTVTPAGAAAAYQPLDSDLSAIALLSTTSYGRALLALADQAALTAAVGAATTSASGISELATSAETQTGTDTVRTVTPAGVASRFSHHRLGKPSGGSTLVGIPGFWLGAYGTAALTVNRDYFSPFEIRSPVTLTLAQYEVTAAPASNATAYVGIVACDDDMQPTGNALLNTTVTCASGATGVKSTGAISVALAPGPYLAVINIDVAMTLRAISGSAGNTTMTATMGASPVLFQSYLARTAGAFASPVAAWTTAGTASGTFLSHYVVYQWTSP